ncbi:hypothetical protein CANTEDRAFT_122357 [Yamadazyma tenuis ATCC 10573]|uniref:ATP-dependent RNA helicase n=2 Tax=Candida tenuis TaxID=2315449 RepID=G3B3E4_CANTC|nr:uncharacterized protein CANTEDRAFT_122357 [Yamadazyma tenuis ATCC 10573]EGV64147.1 hypothetical protein CANTEDRAFT_122357 [Yamadazyma tenuis ATCC 10573]
MSSSSSDNEDDSSESSDDESSLSSESESEHDEEHAPVESVPPKEPESPDNMAVDEDYLTKHQNVFSKFKRSAIEQPAEEAPEASDEDVQDIGPLPQPTLPRDYRLKITQSNHLDWLSKPIYSKPEHTWPFETFDLSDTMKSNLATGGFIDAFSVQVTVLEMMLKDTKENKLKPDSNGDILVNASTGSGKTLAYSIPIIESLCTRVVPRVRAIILVPTKPLVSQVKQTLLQLSKGTSLYVMNLRNDISIREEAEKLTGNPPDIIVSTPGRLVEHVTGNSIDLNSLRYLVIDEADRLLGQSFQNWSRVLVERLEAKQSSMVESWKLRVQKLVFSATLTTDAGKLAMLHFYKPRLVIVNDEEKLVNEMFSTPRTLSEFTLQFSSNKSSLKPLILAKFLMKSNKLSNVLVFTKSNEASIRLSKLLSLVFDGFGVSMVVEYLNSTNNSTMARKKLLMAFDSGQVNVLVVTDLIARGIDVLSITDVVNYDMPNSSREYVHRVGRTARANNDGRAYNFVFGKGEMRWMSRLLRDVSRSREVEMVEEMFLDEGDEEVYRKCLGELQNIVER